VGTVTLSAPFGHRNVLIDHPEPVTTLDDTPAHERSALVELADAPVASLGGTGAVRPPWAAAPNKPVSVRRYVLRFALAGLPVLVLVIIVTAIASVRIGEHLAIDNAKKANRIAAIETELHALDDGILVADDATLERIDTLVRDFVLQDSLTKVKIHGPDGVVLYSNDESLVGQRFPFGPDELAVLGGQIDEQAEISDLSKLENRGDGDTRLLEAYRRITTPNGTPLLFESYFRYDEVTQTGDRLWRQFAPIAVGAFLVLELVQIPFAVSLARRVRSGQQQRERLLQHAVDSSDAERRRIASDLHDGVVQDLTGVSMSLTAGSRVAEHESTREVMVDAGSKIRESVKSLRSMLVDIYPPNLYEEGLRNALADLLGALHNREVISTLDVDADAVTLPRDSVNLLYRSAQEALRNVTSHARATQVAVSVAVTASQAVLTITDNGDGFDPYSLAERARDGHVGLRSLAGLVSDAGGAIEIRSREGAGTQVTVTLPR
jgi:signal transduction histidine kinase